MGDVTKLPIDPLAVVRGLLDEGRDEFREALRSLEDSAIKRATWAVERGEVGAAERLEKLKARAAANRARAAWVDEYVTQLRAPDRAGGPRRG